MSNCTLQADAEQSAEAALCKMKPQSYRSQSVVECMARQHVAMACLMKCIEAMLWSRSRQHTFTVAKLVFNVALYLPL